MQGHFKSSGNRFPGLTGKRNASSEWLTWANACQEVLIWRIRSAQKVGVFIRGLRHREDGSSMTHESGFSLASLMFQSTNTRSSRHWRILVTPGRNVDNIWWSINCIVFNLAGSVPIQRAARSQPHTGCSAKECFSVSWTNRPPTLKLRESFLYFKTGAGRHADADFWFVVSVSTWMASAVIW